MYANAYNSSQPARKASGCKICLIRLTCLYLSIVGLIGLIIIMIGRYLAFLGGPYWALFSIRKERFKKNGPPTHHKLQKNAFFSIKKGGKGVTPSVEISNLF